MPRCAATRALAVLAGLAAMVGVAANSQTAPGPGGLSSAVADSPVVTLALTPTQNPVPAHLTLTASTAVPAASIRKIDFEYAPADTGQWYSPPLGTNPKFVGGLPPYTVNVNTRSLADGLYDLRVVLTEAGGSVDVSPVRRDVLVANVSPVATLGASRPKLAPGSVLRLTAPVQAAVAARPSAPTVAQLSLEYSPADAETWTAIGTLPTTDAGASVNFDTTAVADGTYDLRAVPFDDANPPNGYAAIPVRGVIVDNTAPTVSLDDPGSPLAATAKLTTRTGDAGSGVATVEFQAAKAGTGAWRQIGAAAHGPFAHAFDTTTLDNGAYDFRAIATDAGGNVTISNVVTDTVANPPQPPAARTSIHGVAVAARDITLLGSVANSPAHETWAYGYSSAPPARVDGRRLPYTAEGNQFVLLRYTDDGGWQIADVLRNSDGSAFALSGSVGAEGQMTGSGEAWLAISQHGDSNQTAVVGLFHRKPGGAFVVDDAATKAVGPGMFASLGTGSGQLRLGQTSDGLQYGVLTSPNQPADPVSVQVGGKPVPVGERLDYALLGGGAWTVHSAPLPSSYVPAARDTVTLEFGDVDGPDGGWGAFAVNNANKPAANGLGLLLGHFTGDQWNYVSTGLDALDLVGTVASPQGSVEPIGLKTDGSGVWIGAEVRLAGAKVSDVIARVETTAGGRTTNSWCSLPVASSCDEPLDGDHPAAVPDAVFATSSGSVAIALTRNSLNVFSRGAWTAVPAPGYSSAGDDSFTGPSEGWLGGQSALGRVLPQDSASPLATWAIAERAPLTSVALPPGSNAALGESGALAVGLNGTTLAFDASTGWVVQPTPARAHHINLTSVAFAGTSSAFAVGQFGLILRWDGSAWSEDPQSISLTQDQLNAVGFSAAGEGWAVGTNGTILHYDGTTWTIERPPAVDAATNITSVAVAGSDVFAVAGGNLIMRKADGTWTAADPALFPSSPAPVPGDLRLVAGLPDGGAVVAGRSVLFVRQSSSAPFAYSDQPLEGIPVALATFRDGGVVRAAVSLAPPAADPFPPFGPTRDIGGFPAGDGELLIESASGWRDLSLAAQPGTAADLPPDGAVKPDPVLAVAASPDGRHAWAVGGYAGTPSASGQGSSAILAGRPSGWQTASLWRYDVGGSAPSPALSATPPDLPASPGTVSFAFFSSPLCRVSCLSTQDAQPDTNLAAAIAQISTYGGQPGGPRFAILGGDARGPIDPPTRAAGTGRSELNRLPDLLAPLTLPLFAALGPLDAVPTERDPLRPWADAFAGAPAPFGSGPAPSDVMPVGSGTKDGVVSLYYAFDATQNGATIRVIVLDNSQGSLEAGDVGQTAWLNQQLGAAGAAGLRVVAVAARPLTGNFTTDGSTVAATLASAGVLAVFTSGGDAQLNEVHQVPDDAVTTIPEYEGASLGYQQPQNNGVVWYDVSVDTEAGTVGVNAVPVIQSLALQPLTGLSVARSLTLQFQAVGRRPQGSLATAPKFSDTFPGFDNYVAIPSPSCGTAPCVTPTYAFTSSDPTIGSFVTPSGPGSPFPKLNGKGHPINNARSGLFCAYNAGTTDVSVSAGLLTYTLTVTVQPGGFGQPCGTVAPAAGPAAAKRTNPVSGTAAASPPPPPAAAATAAPAPLIKLPAAPAPAPHPAPAHAPQPAPVPAPTPVPAAAPLQPAPLVSVIPSLVPPVTPAQPIPPGGATAPSSAPARRREKAHKHASQSAFTTLQPGSARLASADASPADGSLSWYFGGVGATTLLVLILAGRGLRPRRRVAAAPIHTDRR